MPLGQPASQPGMPETAGPFAVAIDRIAGLTSEDAFKREMALLRKRLRDLDGASPRQMEEAVRALGESFGFEATRPDNDLGAGPDVLWVSEKTSECVAFELKTDKASPATYNKKDIGQGHNSLQWIADEKPGLTSLGLIFVGPSGDCSDGANPSPGMTLASPKALTGVRDKLIALLADMRRVLPIQRPSTIKNVCSREEWALRCLYIQIKGRSLANEPAEAASPRLRANKP